MVRKLPIFERSFASHKKSDFWSNKNKKLPKDVFLNSHEKYIFDCDKCDHDFYIQLNSVNKNRWCAYCTNQKLCENKECKTCYEKSFASHEKSKFWSNKNYITARQAFKSSNKNYIFDCDICKHDFKILASTVSFMNSWCSYCSKPPKLLCTENDCNLCFDKSFSSNDKAVYWSNKNNIKPRNVFKYTYNKYFFKCKSDHEFESALANISNGKWCPYCKNKTEGILNEWLNENYNHIIHQAYFDWCKNINYLPFDFLLKNYKLIIELDGIQHFEQVSNWKNPEETQKRDKFKMKCALENNYSIIRIKQEDVLFNKINWKSILQEKIKLYDTPNITYIGDYNYYHE